MAEVQIKKLSWWHESLIDWIITNPDKNLGEAAKVFKVSQSWLSVVLHSDAFREKFAQRRDEHFGRVSATITEKLQILADLGIEENIRRLETIPEAVPSGVLKDVTELALKALGFGNKNGNNEGNNGGNHLHLHVADKESLAHARGLMAARTAEFPSQEPVELEKVEEHRENGNGSNQSSKQLPTSND